MTGWSAYLYYLRLFLWPDALVVDRLDYPLTRSFLEPRAWGSLLVLLVLGGLAWRARRRWPALTFAALWYAVALAAEQTIFPLAEPVNEHRPYLAMLGLGTAAGLGLRGAAHLLARPLRVPATRVVVVLVALVAIALGVATAARNEVWRDDGALWRDAVAKAPANPRAWLNAGHAAMARDDRDEARRLLLEAHRHIFPASRWEVYDPQVRRPGAAGGSVARPLLQQRQDQLLFEVAAVLGGEVPGPGQPPRRDPDQALRLLVQYYLGPLHRASPGPRPPGHTSGPSPRIRPCPSPRCSPRSSISTGSAIPRAPWSCTGRSSAWCPRTTARTTSSPWRCWRAAVSPRHVPRGGRSCRWRRRSATGLRSRARPSGSVVRESRAGQGP